MAMNREQRQETERIYQSILEQPEENQEAFLQQACHGDAALRHQVENLLQTRQGTRAGGSGSSSKGARPASGSKAGHTSIIGKKLGAYEVQALLGAGGMGEVYQARDERLDRAVALKVLPEEYSGDPERLARLQREARMLAALNHTNIAAIHGLEESGGKLFLVLELAEGQTLAERLKRKRLPLEEALDFARQIADGLEAAHEKGIVHRDLKPANIKITPDGKVKILDFGLAKVFREPAMEAGAGGELTLTEQMNPPGAILGTAAYMSPEQAKGKPVDKRSDVWAFGCVLYECLAGTRAFHGETTTDVLAAILKSNLDWAALPASTPSRLKDLLQLCLQKDAKDRLHDIGDARIELQQLMAQPEEGAPAAAARTRLRPSWLLAASLAGTVVGLVLGAVAARFFLPKLPGDSPPAVRSILEVEPGHWLEGQRRPPPTGTDQPTRTAMAVASDGRFIVYSAVSTNAGSQEQARLFLRRLAELQARPIPGTEGGSSPVLSPDDKWIGFWAGGKLTKVPVDGGVPAALAEVPLPFGFSWSGPDSIVLTLREESGLVRVSASGGAPEVLTTPDRAQGEYSHRLPFCLPEGQGILFTIMEHGHDPQPRVAVLDRTGKRRVLLKNGADARYLPTGHLVFLRQGTLMVAAFDVKRLEVTGQAVPAVAGVGQALNMGNSIFDTAAGQFCVSASGMLVYVAGGVLPDMQNSLVWVDHEGKPETLAQFTGPFFGPRLSPDGRRIAYSTLGMAINAWVYDVERGTATRLVAEGRAGWLVWSPDGQRLIFAWQKDGADRICWQAADGSAPMEPILENDRPRFPASWSPDGETLAFVEAREHGTDICLLHLRDRTVTPFLNSQSEELHPAFSPDGRWLAYTSEETGRPEVYMQAVPGPGRKLRISDQGGSQPLWARDGKTLFYRAVSVSGPFWSSDAVWAADLQTGQDLQVGKPRRIFSRPGYQGGTPVGSWDISPDGKRFVMVQTEVRRAQPISGMILVQNWRDEVRRLAPVSR